jgi:hypothetical protein
MLPAIPRSSSARQQSTIVDGVAQLSRMKRHTSAPIGLGSDSGAGAATTTMTTGSSTTTTTSATTAAVNEENADSSSLCLGPAGNRAVVAGNGCAAVKASRENRIGGLSPSPDTSDQLSGNTCNTTANAKTHDTTPIGTRVRRQLDTHSAGNETRDGEQERVDTLVSPVASLFDKGPLAEKGDAGDNTSVHLLQHMQQLLLDGVSAEALQQWIATQLRRAETAGLRRSSEPSLDPTQTVDHALLASGAPGVMDTTGSGSSGGGSNTLGNPRRLTSAVSFSLVSTYPASQPLSAKMSPFHSANTVVASPATPELAMSGADVSLVPTLPVQLPQSPTPMGAARAAKRATMTVSPPLTADNASSVEDNNNSGRLGFTTTAAAVNTSFVVPVSPTRGQASFKATTNTNTSEEAGNTSMLGVHIPGAAGRRGSLSVVCPPSTTPGNGSAPVITASGGGVSGSLLKAPRMHTPGQQSQQPLQPQQQWRTYTRSGSATDMPAHSVTAFAQANATTMRRAQETSLHEVTKAAFHATTSRLIADDQRNIGLLLGERFSRNPESMVRRLATPPASMSTTLVVTTVPEGRRQSTCSAGDSCLPSALYDRAELSVTSPRAGSPTITKGVATVPLGVGSNYQLSDGPGPLSYHSQLYSAEEPLSERRRRSFEQRNEESFLKGASTAVPAVSERSTPVDLSSPSISRAATPQSMTPPAAAIANSRGNCSSVVSFLNASVVGNRRQRSCVQSTESAPTLPNSVPGTAGTLTCEQDALFPQHSLLVSPAVSPVAGAAATAAKMMSGLRSDSHRSLSPPSAVVAATSSAPDTSLPPAAEEEEDTEEGEGLPHGVVAGAAKRCTLANVIPLIDVVPDADDGGSVATGCDFSHSTSNNKANTNSSNNAAASASGVGSDGLCSKGGGAPRAWGVAAATSTAHTSAADAGGAAAAASAGAGAAATLPPVSASVVSLAWTPSSASTMNANASESSPLTASGGCCPIGFHHVPPHRSTQAYARVASFASNASSQLGTGHNNATSNLNGFVASHGALPEGRSFISFGDDMQSFESSRVSCVSGIRDAPATGASSSNRLRRSSVLHLSHASLNGGIDPQTDGVMPDFVLDGASSATHRPGPLFRRTYCRHSPARVVESVTRQLLAELDVPYLSNIDEASNSMNVLHFMEFYNYKDGRAFYVVMCLNVMLRYNLVRRFAWDTRKLKRFFEVTSTFFRDGNPFHHIVHATDMVLGAHQWLCEGTTAAALSDDEVAAFLLSAMTLQLSHTGVDNRLLTQLKHPYAMLCSFTSPQQGAIVALVMALVRYPELHFFPDPSSASVNVNAEPIDPAKDTAPANVAHEWTASREIQLFDMLSELVMATDLRNHAVLQQGILRMAEENAQRHGCLCSGAPLAKPLSPSRAAKSGRARGGASLGTTTARGQHGDGGSGNRQVCLNCCAYVTENHVPDLLKGVLHYLGFPFLYRTYENYVSGTLMYVAEVYRQSEVEYKIFQHQQQTALGNSQNSSQSPAFDDTLSVPAFVKSALARGSTLQQGNDVENSTATFATAVMEERPPWRQDVGHASTVATLQRRRSAEMQPGSALPSRRPTATALEPYAVGAPPQFEWAACGPSHAGSDDVTSTETAAPPKPPRVRPLLGHGRDILLIGVEDLSLPFVELFAPYLPESWVLATYMNHQTFTVATPSPEEYDEAVLRVLDLAEESEEEIMKRQEEDAGVNDLMATVPWLLLRRICPSNPDWSVNKDGLTRRVIDEVVKGTESLLERCEV